MKNKVQLIFPMITYVLAFIVYFIAKTYRESIPLTDMLCLFLLPLLGFFFPIYEKVSKKQIPILLNILFCSEIIFCIYGGGALDLYTHIPIYDLILHGYFGLVGSIFIYYFLCISQDKINFTLYCFIPLIVLGVGVVWEIWEYSFDTIFSADTQRVQEALELGVSPVKDTMEDLIITILGVCLFYGFLSLDKYLNHTIFHSFYTKKEQELDMK